MLVHEISEMAFRSYYPRDYDPYEVPGHYVVVELDASFGQLSASPFVVNVFRELSDAMGYVRHMDSALLSSLRHGIGRVGVGFEVWHVSRSDGADERLTSRRFDCMLDVQEYVIDYLGDFAKDYDYTAIASELVEWRDGYLCPVIDDGDLWRLCADHPLTECVEVA